MTQLHALLLSFLFEAPVAAMVGVGPTRAGPRIGRARAALMAVAATCLTHPFAWATFDALRAHLPYWPRAALVESTVIGAEALLFAAFGMPWRRAFATSAAANTTSFFVGWLIRVGSG